MDSNTSNPLVRVAIKVNGVVQARVVEPRTTLVDFVREHLGLTGTHVGCEHGICGACSVLLDGDPVRSCCMFAVQADGLSVTTVEGLAPQRGCLSKIQDAFCETHALQCGYCTPGMLVACHALVEKTPHPSEAQIREAIGGNICRCTGYQQIVDAVTLATRPGYEVKVTPQSDAARLAKNVGHTHFRDGTHA